MLSEQEMEIFCDHMVDSTGNNNDANEITTTCEVIDQEVVQQPNDEGEDEAVIIVSFIMIYKTQNGDFTDTIETYPDQLEQIVNTNPADLVDKLPIIVDMNNLIEVLPPSTSPAPTQPSPSSPPTEQLTVCIQIEMICLSHCYPGMLLICFLSVPPVNLVN